MEIGDLIFCSSRCVHLEANRQNRRFDRQHGFVAPRKPDRKRPRATHQISRRARVSTKNQSMNAPISEVPPHVPKKRDFAKTPPPLLSTFCATDAIIVILLMVLHTPIPETSRFWDWSIHGVITILALTLTYYLWCGYGLARGIWLWLTVLTMPFYFLTDPTYQPSRIEQTLSYLNGAVNLFSLIYLNLPNVKAHFARRKTVELG